MAVSLKQWALSLKRGAILAPLFVAIAGGLVVTRIDKVSGRATEAQLTGGLRSINPLGIKPQQIISIKNSGETRITNLSIKIMTPYEPREISCDTYSRPIFHSEEFSYVIVLSNFSQGEAIECFLVNKGIRAEDVRISANETKAMTLASLKSIGEHP